MLSKLKTGFKSIFSTFKAHPIVGFIVLMLVVVLAGPFFVMAYNRFKALPGVNKVPLPESKVA